MLNVQNFLKCFTTASLFVLGILVSHPAIAAPQILGLLASAKPIPLTCKNGFCTAEISTYCLQSHRSAPESGTRYQFASDRDVSILAKTASGKSIELTLSEFATIKSARGHSSLQYSIAESLLAKRGVSSAHIVIGKFASAIPQLVENDKNPISKAELEAYTGPLRQVADQIIGKTPTSTTIAETLNTLLNHFDEKAPVSRAGVTTLWKKAIGDYPTEASSDGLRYAAKELDVCANLSTPSNPFSSVENGTRQCLEAAHDRIAAEITNRVWSGLGPGG